MVNKYTIGCDFMGFSIYNFLYKMVLRAYKEPGRKTVPSLPGHFVVVYSLFRRKSGSLFICVSLGCRVW